MNPKSIKTADLLAAMRLGITTNDLIAKALAKHRGSVTNRLRELEDRKIVKCLRPPGRGRFAREGKWKLLACKKGERE